jgi:virulence factor
MSTSEVRVGVIGAGGIAQSVHLPSLSEMPDVKIVALCDLLPDRSAAMGKKYHVERTYLSLHEMLAKEELDAVYALVEPGSLFHVVWNALNSGRHVFMEKPPGITSTQAWALARKAEEKKRFLQVGFNRRYIPVVRRAVEMVRGSTKINQVDGCFYKFGDAAFDRGGVSAFVSDTIHALDLLRWMAGGEAKSAAMVEACYDGAPVSNAWNGIIRFDNGVTGVIRANYKTGGRVHRFEAHGAGTSAYIDVGMGEEIACSAAILTHQGEVRYSLAAAGAAAERVERLDGAELAGSTEFHRAYGYYQEDRAFIDCVKGKGKPEPDITDAARSMDLAEMLLANRI